MAVSCTTSANKTSERRQKKQKKKRPASRADGLDPSAYITAKVHTSGLTVLVSDKSPGVQCLYHDAFKIKLGLLKRLHLSSPQALGTTSPLQGVKSLFASVT